MTGLLDGIQVIETGVLLAVDHLGAMLGDEGADVIKVETPELGDYLRNIGPLMDLEWSTPHLSLNRNKRSVTIDARTTAGREIVSRLLQTADVFTTGNIGDTNRKLGFDYETVREINPRIVYCQITGFGSSGPYAEIPTHGKMMDALGGETPQMELGDDGLVTPVPGARPERSSGGVVIGPMYAAFAVAAGLSRRDRTGRGCYIDVSCADAVLASKGSRAIQKLNRERFDGDDPTLDIDHSAKYQHYQTADARYVLFCCIEPKFWDNFCRASDREDLLDQHDRSQAVDFGFGDESLRRELQDVFVTKSQFEWVELARRHDIPLCPALRFDEVAADPHMQARGMVQSESHPILGQFLTLGSPIRVFGESFSLRSAPSHGEHTEEVLGAIGYSRHDVEQLRRDGVV
jgi:crotonobetainyl-CoA:carnitine CoA-transferase CaiB-like acyl-CoA transferase